MKTTFTLYKLFLVVIWIAVFAISNQIPALSSTLNCTVTFFENNSLHTEDNSTIVKVSESIGLDFSGRSHPISSLTKMDSQELELSEVWYPDMDGDGRGDINYPGITADQQAFPGWVTNNDDCDDTNPSIYPGAPGTNQGIDNNCDGVIDPEEWPTWYPDTDGDGYGPNNVPGIVSQNPPGPGTVSSSGDCDETNPNVYPGAPGTHEGIDNNCDGVITGDEMIPMWWPDADGDGYGDKFSPYMEGQEPPVNCDNYVNNNGDCDDSNPNVYPGALGTGEGIDNNCDGMILDDEVLGAPKWYPDEDEDSYGDAYSNGLYSFDQPFIGWIIFNHDDCDDTNPNVYPGALATGQGIDNNCDGFITFWENFQDSDGDGLADWLENILGTNPMIQDTDGDGLLDGEEVSSYFTNPLMADSDGDGYSDYDEIFEYGTDPNDADSDDDGLTDCQETVLETDPNDPDSDSDGINDGMEVNFTGTNPNNDDTDEDGVNDADEIANGTNPNDEDTDDDGASDGQENDNGTDPNNFDSDGDGLSDYQELYITGTNPLNPDTDGNGIPDYYDDTDGDGIPNWVELMLGTNPDSADSDGDGLPDNVELWLGTDPLDPDSDDDGLNDFLESASGTDPHNPDTDGDGVWDGDEYYNFMNPLNVDTDGDGLSDGFEWFIGTDPTDPDTDNDGLSDGQEGLNNTNPFNPDSDGDGMSDGYEVQNGTDPLDPCSPVAGSNCSSFCEGDFNSDLAVNISDLLIFVSEFGCSLNCGNVDMNQDGTLNTVDLLLFMTAFGNDCGF